MEIQKFKYLENEKRVLEQINTFHSFWRFKYLWKITLMAYRKNGTEDRGPYEDQGRYEDLGPYEDPRPVLSFLLNTFFG